MDSDLPVMDLDELLSAAAGGQPDNDMADMMSVGSSKATTLKRGGETDDDLSTQNLPMEILTKRCKGCDYMVAQPTIWCSSQYREWNHPEQEYASDFCKYCAVTCRTLGDRTLAQVTTAISNSITEKYKFVKFVWAWFTLRAEGVLRVTLVALIARAKLFDSILELYCGSSHLFQWLEFSEWHQDKKDASALQEIIDSTVLTLNGKEIVMVKVPAKALPSPAAVPESPEDPLLSLLTSSSPGVRNLAGLRIANADTIALIHNALNGWQQSARPSAPTSPTRKPSASSIASLASSSRPGASGGATTPADAPPSGGKRARGLTPHHTRIMKLSDSLEQVFRKYEKDEWQNLNAQALAAIMRKCVSEQTLLVSTEYFELLEQIAQMHSQCVVLTNFMGAWRRGYSKNQCDTKLLELHSHVVALIDILISKGITPSCHISLMQVLQQTNSSGCQWL